MERLPRDLWSDPGLERKYRFEQELASSAMAVVVAARHLELDERVAIKFLSPEAIGSSVAVARFRREAKAAASIKNQHVVRIVDISVTVGGIPYIVMEFLDGRNLERLLLDCPQRQAPIADAVDFVLQASEAIIEGHALGIVHRDLKPANLFCVDRGDGFPLIKVLDFGISKHVATSGDVAQTDRYEILGSPRYMSPEQINLACAVDHRTDIWSMGVILYEAIAGKPPFSGDTVPELWRNIRFQAPESLQTHRRECPAELWAAVAKCLEKEPSRRYANLGALALALAPIAPERSKGSVARIRWTVDVVSQTTSRLSNITDGFDRAARNPARGRHRWVVAGGIASTLGFGLTWAAMQRASVVDELPASASDRNHGPDLAVRDSAALGATSIGGAGSVPVPAPVSEIILGAPSGKPRRTVAKNTTGRTQRAAFSGVQGECAPSSAEPQLAPAVSTSAVENTGTRSRGVWVVPPVTVRK